MASPSGHGGGRTVAATLAMQAVFQQQEADREARHLVNTPQGPSTSPSTQYSIASCINASLASYCQTQTLGSQQQYTPGTQQVSRSPSMCHLPTRNGSSHLHAATAASLLPCSTSSGDWSASSGARAHQQPRHLHLGALAIETQEVGDDTHMDGCEMSSQGGQLYPISSLSRGSSLGSTVKRQKTKDARFSVVLSSNRRRGSEPFAGKTTSTKPKQRATKACDKCREQKCKCVADPHNPRSCTQCGMLGTACTFHGPSLKRGPPKGYLAAVINRLEAMEDTILAKLTGAADDPRARQLLLELIGESTLSQVLSGRIEFGRSRSQGLKKGNGPYGTVWHESWWVKGQGIPVNASLSANSRSLGSRFLDPMRAIAADHSIAQTTSFTHGLSLSSSGGEDQTRWDCEDVAAASGRISRSANSAATASERDLNSTGSTLSLIEAAADQTSPGSSPLFDWQSQAKMGSAAGKTNRQHPFQPSGRPPFHRRVSEAGKDLANDLRRGSSDAVEPSLVPLDQAEQYAVQDDICRGTDKLEGLEQKHTVFFSALSGMHKISHCHCSFNDSLWHIPGYGESDNTVSSSVATRDEQPIDILSGVERYFAEIHPQLPVLSKSYYEKLKNRRALGDTVPSLESLELTMYEASRAPGIRHSSSNGHRVYDDRSRSPERHELPSLLKVISLVIKGFSLLSQDECVDACSCIGAAVANAQAIGLHKTNKSTAATALFDANESLARKTAWSSCLFLDKMVLAMGFSSSIDTRFCDAVAATPDDVRAAQSSELMPCSDQSIVADVRLLAWLHRWAVVMDCVAVTLYTTKQPSRAEADRCEERVLALEESFQQLPKGEEPPCRPHRTANDNDRCQPLVALRSLLHKVWIQLHWRFNTQLRQIASTQSAMVIARLLEETSVPLRLPTWAVHSVFIAATELVASLNSATNQEGRNTILQRLKTIKHALKDGFAVLPLAAHRLILLEGAYLSDLADSNDEASRSNGQTTLQQQFSALHRPQRQLSASPGQASVRPLAGSATEPPIFLPLSTAPDSCVDTRMSLGCPNGSLYSSAPETGIADWGAPEHTVDACTAASENAVVDMRHNQAIEMISDTAEPSRESQHQLLFPLSSSLLRNSYPFDDSAWTQLSRPGGKSSSEDVREQRDSARQGQSQEERCSIKAEAGREVGSTTEVTAPYSLAHANVVYGQSQSNSTFSGNRSSSFARGPSHPELTRVFGSTGAVRAPARPMHTYSPLGTHDSFLSQVIERRGPCSLSFPPTDNSEWSVEAKANESTLWNGCTSPEQYQGTTHGTNASRGVDTNIGLGLSLKLSNAAPAEVASSALGATPATSECTSGRGMLTSLISGSRSPSESSSTLRKALDFQRLKEEPGISVSTLAGICKSVRSSASTKAPTRPATNLECDLVRSDEQER